MALGIYLALAANLVSRVFIPATSFTLSWTHCIEKIRWEENYVVVPDTANPARAREVALKARIKGTGAGMEPPEGARLIHGWYAYVPDAVSAQPLPRIRSEFTTDYEWCARGQWQSMGKLLASDHGVTLMTPCLGKP